MKRTVSGWVLIAVSWLLFFVGLITSLFYWYIKDWKLCAIYFAGGIVVWISLRALANINEFLFNLCVNSFEILKIDSRMEHSLESCSQDIKSIVSSLEDSASLSNKYLKALVENIAYVKDSLEIGSQGIKSIINVLKEDTSLLDQNITNIKESLETNSQDVKAILNQRLGFLVENISNIKKSLERDSQDIKSIVIALKEDTSLSNKNTLDTNQNIQRVDQTLQQINCDSKDISQNLFKLRSFLEDIERHLDLKK